MADASATNGAELGNSPPADVDEEVNNSIKPDPEPSSSDTQGRGDAAMSLDGSSDQLPASLQIENATAADEVEARIPQKKDATLKEFLGKMDDYAPIVCFPSPTIPSSRAGHRRKNRLAD